MHKIDMNLLSSNIVLGNEDKEGIFEYLLGCCMGTNTKDIDLNLKSKHYTKYSTKKESQYLSTEMNARKFTHFDWISFDGECSDWLMHLLGCMRNSERVMVIIRKYISQMEYL